MRDVMWVERTGLPQRIREATVRGLGMFWYARVDSQGVEEVAIEDGETAGAMSGVCAVVVVVSSPRRSKISRRPE